MNANLSELQNELLPMLKWFHNFCEKEHLTYYANGGTVLGAIRHNGFIPWDDDIDVGMPRPDYEKLKKIANKINSEKDNSYQLEWNIGKDDFPYFFMKLYNINTTLIENYKIPVNRGIYIDIFPIDGIGNSINESFKIYKKIKKIKMFRSLFLYKPYGYNLKNIPKNLLKLTTNYIPKKIMSAYKLFLKLEKIRKQYDYNQCEYVINIEGAYGAKEMMKKEIFGNPVLWDFEGIKIYIPEKYDKYLTNVYGDYMTPPPKDKQVSHHDYLYLNLNEPYIKNKY